MTIVDDQQEDEELDFSAPETRAAGRWNSAGVPGERSKDFKKSIRRMARMLGPMWVVLGVVVAVAVASATLNVFGPRVLGHGTDIIVKGVQSGKGIRFAALHTTLFHAVELYVASSGLAIIAAYMLAGVIQRLMFKLRSDVEDKVNRLPLSYIDKQSRGDLLSRVTNDIDNVAQSLQQTLSQMLTSVLLLIGTAVMMFTISPFLAVVALTTVPISIWGMRAIAARSRPKFISQWKQTGLLNAQIEETFTGHAVVKSFGRQHEVEQRFRDTNDELYESSFGAQFMSSLMQPFTMFMGNIQYVIVAIVGGLRVSTGAITIGDIQAFIQYSRQFSMPLTQVASMMNVFQSGIASFERVTEFLDADEQSAEAPATVNAPPVRGRVEFRDVTFSYDPDRPLIENLSLVAEPGQTIAIVGPTGAGKTTLVNLIMRFYELNSGEITLDGRNIASMPRSELRSKIGMVLQDTWLFGGSIHDNIAYGNPDATEEQIFEAARATYVDRFVHSLPDGYNTLINEEADNVSAGQKQLLTIARAFLADPAILILDEATSSVDTRTEVLIQEAMNALRHERTSFVIAHRLSTIRGADVILVMENGRIVEQGSHSELLNRDGPYFRLYNSQFVSAAVDIDAEVA
ncbi:MAG TPA: ABC transporter ATP-binding protein [Acidimicrobiia bacterium]|jgi:ATP-binding cassette subfamily B protein|nr:ABC transporter ATP-binding protein [Acidimicrobiia bacterium]